MRNLNLFHIVPFGPGFNIGNFLIQQSVRRLIKSQTERNVNFITIFSKGYENMSGLTKSTVYRINEESDGVVLGGGNLFENGDLEVDINALQALRKPMISFSCSYGKIYDQNGSLMRRTDAIQDIVMKEVIKASQVILSRDQATKDHLDSISKHDNHVVGGCPSIFIKELLNEEIANVSQDSKFPLLAIRNPDQMNVPYKIKNLIPSLTYQLLDLMKSISDKEPIILCNDQRDIAYAKSFDHEFLYTSDVYEYFEILMQVSHAISYRVHTSLPLWSLGTNVVNLSYDQRSVSLVDFIGGSQKDINIVKNYKDIIPKTEKILKEGFKKDITNNWQSIKEIQKKSIKDFFSIVNEK